MERTVRQWLELIEQGPDEEDHECRGCTRFMKDVLEDGREPTALCHNCAQLFLPLLVEKYKKLLGLAVESWRVVQELGLEEFSDG